MKNTIASLLVLASTTIAQAKITNFESDANGFNTKNFFYDNGKEVVVVDTQFTTGLAEQSIKFIQSQTKSPIKFVIITHPNPDKFNGMSAFQKLGAKVIASKASAEDMPGVHAYKKYFFVNMAKMFTEETYPALSKPDITFDKSYTLTLSNGEKIELTETNKAAISSNQTLVSIPSEKALIVGDLVHHKAHAWLEGGIVNGNPKPEIKGWIETLKGLKKNFSKDTVVFGGRGESAKLETSVNDQVNYLEKLDAIVTAQVKKAGKGQEQFTVIQAQAEKAFPDYKLGYMIQYGVYGLVNSK